MSQMSLGGLGVVSSAFLDATGDYRYLLTRSWAPGPVCLFVMLNPSTADASVDDPTIRRCRGFASDWGFGTLRVVNLFALRATDPSRLWTHPDPVGPENDATLAREVPLADRVVAAWGAGGKSAQSAKHAAAMAIRVAVVREVTKKKRTVCLRLSKGGYPAHPLYVPADATVLCWE